jgi:tripartite-type tricarboxylate transporter receptor subunit TctC
MEGKHEVPAFPRQTAAAILGLATFAAAPLAHAQDAIAKFYANKNLKLIIGAPTGSRLDVPGRQVARHLGKHIPGHPNIVASDRPGAASNILGRHMFAQASKDRATIGLVFPGVMTEALFNGDDRRGCDPSQFNFLCSVQNYMPACIARRRAGEGRARLADP